MEIAFVVSFAVLGVLGILIGFRLGTELGERAVTAGEFWGMNAALLAGGIVLGALIGAAGLVLLEAVPVGIIAGGLTGLKMAFGESVGPWKFVDRFFNINKAHQRAAASGAGAARRRRRAEGADEPDLISVGGDAPKTADPAGGKRTAGRRSRKG